MDSFEKKYKEALERAKELSKSVTGAFYDEIFPELADSEDERIRNEIIKFLELPHPPLVGKRHQEDWIAWLEKQGEQNKINSYKITFEDVLALECAMKTVKITKGGNELYEMLVILYNKIHNAYLVEKQDEQKPIIDGILTATDYDKMFQNCKQDEQTVWTDNDYDKVKSIEYLLHELDNHNFDDWFNSLIPPYKESADSYCQKHCKGFQETGKCFADGDCETKKEAESINKVEPKFHKGEWITNGDYTWKIVEVKPLDYMLQSQDGNIVYDTISYVDEQFHSFTIQDAKDGDVLVASDGSFFLFAGVVDCACKYYVALTTDNYVKINKEAKGGYWETSRAVYPATKEQRDLLFNKMKEAGYEWDAEKKELNNIEDEPKNYKQHIMSEITDLVTDYIRQKPSWSEEDEEMIDSIMDYMMPMPIFFESTKGKSGKEYTKEFVKNATKWLKSLKKRIKGE